MRPCEARESVSNPQCPAQANREREGEEEEEAEEEEEDGEDEEEEAGGAMGGSRF